LISITDWSYISIPIFTAEYTENALMPCIIVRTKRKKSGNGNPLRATQSFLSRYRDEAVCIITYPLPY